MKSENNMASCIGDYNISLMNIESHGLSQEFTEMMYPFSMYPCITKPTRVTTKSASLIDNIFCNNMPDSSLLTGVLFTDISDHFPIFHIDKSLTNSNYPKYLNKRMDSVENQEKFVRLLRERNWSDVLSSEDPQSAFSLFSQGYIGMYKDCFPLKTVKSGYKTRKPWLREGLSKVNREKK